MTSQKIALITGASSGLGACFARKLAGRQYNLILVARRRERLAALANELEEAETISAEMLVADLSIPDGVEQVEGRICRLEALDLLVNNAGFGTTGQFARTELPQQLDMIQVHVMATVRLSRAALPGMIARSQGRIINVSSLAAFIPMPGNVTYCATKAYLNSFSRALQVELAGTGVQIQALCPGFTYTEFHNSTEYPQEARNQIPKMLWMSAEAVVEASLNALDKEQVVYIPGLKNRLLAGLITVTPDRLQQWILIKGQSVLSSNR